MKSLALAAQSIAAGAWLALAGLAQPPVAQATDALANVEEPTGGLSLSQALALGLARSPELEAFSHQLRASEAHALQAGLLPNPELSVELEDVGGKNGYSGTKSAQTTLRLGQLIELGGKRSARREVAAATRDVVGREYEVKRVDVLADVTEKFVEVLATQHEVVLTKEATQLGQSALDAARRRVQAGKASALEEKKAAIALARSRIDEEHAEHELSVARKSLAATWASTAPAFARAEGDLFARQKIPPFQALAERAVNSPETTRWVSASRLREAEVSLAKAKRVPNLHVGAGVRRLEAPDTEVFVAELSLPLPILDRNQGGVAEARALSEKTEIDRRGAAIRTEAALFGLYQELLHAAVASESLQQVVLPQAREALALSQKGFGEGRFSYLDLLDAQRTFVEVQTEAIETAVSYHRLLLAIERLLGQPIDASNAGQ